MPKRHLEAATPAARAKIRRQLGTLKELTVQPTTRARYDAAINQFLVFLKRNALQLPKERSRLDPLICDYLEHLWATGSGRALASDTLAGLQDFDPKIRGQIPGAWRLLKTWHVNEIPNRAPPLPVHIVHAMCGWACFHQHYSFAVSLLIGFYAMLRTGEILGLTKESFTTEAHQSRVLVNLGLTKSGKRAGAAESVVLGYDTVVRNVQQWLRLAKSRANLTPSPAIWRARFNEAIVALKLESFGFRPYSLRRGGATFWFAKHHSLDKILLQGRWTAAKTARVYLNEGLAVLAEIRVPPSDPRIASFLSIFESKLRSPSFATLEPPVGRTGGRGRGHKSKRNSRFQSREKEITVGVRVFKVAKKRLQ